jgi:hypothetical protein
MRSASTWLHAPARRAPFLLLAPVLLCALPRSDAFASGPDPVPSLDLRGFRASTDPASGIYLEPASSPHTLDYNL